jgi:hypothetical protein
MSLQAPSSSEAKCDVKKLRALISGAAEQFGSNLSSVQRGTEIKRKVLVGSLAFQFFIQSEALV